MTVSLKGINQVNANLNREIRKIQGRSLKGLLEASIFIRREMDKTSPKIPVDTNKLRASWFTYPFRAGMNPVLLMGFDAEYAVFVHEMVDRGEINWNREGSGPKFFETHLDRNHTQILTIIANNVEIK